MKLRYEHLAIIFLALAGYCPAAAQVVLKPQFQRLGVVQPGKHYHLKVKINNPTTQTISLWNLRADCDCTSAHITQAVLKPKTTTTMAVDYHPLDGENGFKTFTITFQVYSEDKTHALQKKMDKFMFSAELRSPYVFDPPVMDGGYVLTGHPKEIRGTLKLDTKVYSSWKPDQATTSVAGFQAKVQPLKARGLFDVLLSMPATMGQGDYAGTVTLAGRGKTTKASNYPFHVIVGSLWSVTPKTLDWGVLEPANMKSPKITTQVRQIYGKSFKIVKVEGVPDWLRFQYGKNPVGDPTIEWEIDKGKLEKAKDGLLNSEVTVQTDLKDEPIFKIPLNAVKVNVTERKITTQPVAKPTLAVQSPTPVKKDEKTQ